MAYLHGEASPTHLGPIDKAAIKKLYGSPSSDGKQVVKWSWNAKKEILTQTGKAGNDGNDRLQGLHGNDKLSGGHGNDVLIGGPGRDSFIFDSQPADDTNVDRIVDFDGIDDRITLSSAIFLEAGPDGQLSEATFVTGSSAKDATSRIIFDYGYSFALYYDPDGTGARPQIKFAIMNYTTLAAHHFLIV
jgi:Ca2+-binding RTX toxin-like protein